MDQPSSQRQDVIERVLGSAHVIMWEARLPPVSFTYVSPYAETLLGHPVELWYQAGFWEDLIHPEDRTPSITFCLRQTEAGIDHSVEYRMRHRDGHYLWIRDIITVVEPTGDTMWMRGAMLDITEERKMLEALRQAKEEAEAASKARTRLLTQVGHELRTPLNAALGAVQLMQLRRLSPELEPLVGIVGDASETLLALIDDVMDLARSWSHAMTLEERWLDPLALAETMVASFAGPAHRAGMTLAVEADLPAGLEVRADAARLRQILSNLIGNALRHAGEGAITVEIGSAVAGMRGLSVAVHDTGRGMSPEVAARAFEPFYRGGKSYSEIGDGMGLGLSIVQQITQAMGGEAVVESTEGEGTSVRLALPLAVRQAQVVAKTPSSSAVLCVEDNLTNGFILGQLLDTFGVAHVFASDGANAVELYSADPERFALVLMDVRMQPMDGLDATRHIRAVEKGRGLDRAPIVAITAHTLPENVTECLTAGMDGHLAKPLRTEDLRNVLAQHGLLAEEPVR
ncbi:MAG: ATP-binding protein [Pseudomonadota bacterium]